MILPVPRRAFALNSPRAACLVFAGRRNLRTQERRCDGGAPLRRSVTIADGSAAINGNNVPHRIAPRFAPDCCKKATQPLTARKAWKHQANPYGIRSILIYAGSPAVNLCGTPGPGRARSPVTSRDRPTRERFVRGHTLKRTEMAETAVILMFLGRKPRRSRLGTRAAGIRRVPRACRIPRELRGC